MRFMLMMNVPAGTGDYQIDEWTPEDFKAHIDFMRDLNIDLKQAGELVAGEGLTPPGEAKLVRAAKNGRENGKHSRAQLFDDEGSPAYHGTP